MLSYLGQGLLIGFSAGITPGPLLAFYLSQSIRNGWRRTIAGAFAPLVSDGPIILLILVLLSRVPERLLNALGLAGGLFLLYTAWMTFARARSEPDPNAAQPEASRRTIWTAALINLLNPNPYIFWGTVLGPTLVRGWRENPAYGLAYAGGFYAAMIAIFAAWIIAAGTVGMARPRVQQTVSYISAAGLAMYGVFQIGAALGF